MRVVSCMYHIIAILRKVFRFTLQSGVSSRLGGAEGGGLLIVMHRRRRGLTPMARWVRLRGKKSYR